MIDCEESALLEVQSGRSHPEYLGAGGVSLPYAQVER